MILHLIKLSVGSTSPASLEAWQKHRAKEGRELMHVTRMTPKRAEELLNGGSIYWVIKGVICARNQLTELRPLVIDGVNHCGLMYQAPLIRVTPRPHRAFQGWRYLNGPDAPPDLVKGAEDLPEAMMRELAGLGLL